MSDLKYQCKWDLCY